MPLIRYHQSSKVTKALNVGKPGAGKTTATAALAAAGYRMIYMDYDNGLDIVRNLVAHMPREVQDKVYFETFTDEMKMVTGMSRTSEDGPLKQTAMMVCKGMPTAFTRSMNGLVRWRFATYPGSKEFYDLGNIGSWGPDTVLVVDSLGLAANAALRFVRQTNMHQLDDFISQPDYGQAMNKIEGMLELLYSAAVQCNVIVNTHIVSVEDKRTGEVTGEPRALGSKLPPKVGGYFNTIIKTETKGVGDAASKIIKTAGDATFELKVPLEPGALPKELPIKDGLVALFHALQANEWREDADMNVEKEETTQ